VSYTPEKTCGVVVVDVVVDIIVYEQQPKKKNQREMTSMNWTGDGGRKKRREKYVCLSVCLCIYLSLLLGAVMVSE